MCAREVKRHSSGVKHFLKGVKKNLGGGLTPLTPPENPPMYKRSVSELLGQPCNKSDIPVNLVTTCP